MPRRMNQVGQHVDDVNGGELPLDPDGHTLAGELVQDVEHAEGPAVIRPVMDEVVGPDVVYCSACNSDPTVSSHFNSLWHRSAHNSRAEQQSAA